MTNFVVSARKYRPARFEDVVGQEHVAQTLKNALKNDHLAHAFLFCGPRGVGKTTCARILAKVLNCQNISDDFEPCNTCNSCQSFNENASFNITELDAASNNSVEHIRALIEQVRFQPQQGKYKVFIIDEVHMLSQQAFNAFLKTLEEPPSYAIFILATTEKHKIIPTILSRCQIFDFKRIQVPAMVAHLEGICKTEKIAAENDALHVIAQKADGALRDALSIFDRIVSFSGDAIRYSDVIENLNILDYDYFFKVVDGLLTEDMSAILVLFDDVLRKGFDGDLFINGLAEHLRNLLVCKDPQTITLLEVSEALQVRYQEQAQLAPAALLLTALSLCNDCDIHYKTARNKRLHVEMALLKMTYIQRAFRAEMLPGSAGDAPVAANPVEKKTPEQNVVIPKPPELQLDTDSAPDEPEVSPAVKAEEPSPANLPKTPEPNKYAEQQVNLSDLLAEVQASEPQEAEAIELTAEAATAAWENYIEQNEQDSVKNILQEAEIQVGEDGLQVVVGSKLAESVIRDEQSAMMDYLKQELKNKNLALRITIDPSKQKEAPQRKKPMTDREKFLKMAESNALVHEIRKRFDLRPDGD